MEDINDSAGSGSGESSDDDIYEVQKIMGMTQSKGKTLYKVRWAGYDPSWDTWEPYENLQSCVDMIEAYLEEQKQKKEKSTESGASGQSDGSGSSVEKKPPSKKKKGTYYYVSESDEEADTLKDKFWRELEEGKINVFANDMYSKVKGRCVKPKSGTSDESESPSEKFSGGRIRQSSVDKIHTSEDSSDGAKKKRSKVKKQTETASAKKKQKVTMKVPSRPPDVTRDKPPDGESGGEGSKRSGSDGDKPRRSNKGSYFYVSESDAEADTLKDKFWRELDEGKINVFTNDMYSKVKGGRACHTESTGATSSSPEDTAAESSRRRSDEQDRSWASKPKAQLGNQQKSSIDNNAAKSSKDGIGQNPPKSKKGRSLSSKKKKKKPVLPKVTVKIEEGVESCDASPDEEVHDTKSDMIAKCQLKIELKAGDVPAPHDKSAYAKQTAGEPGSVTIKTEPEDTDVVGYTDTATEHSDTETTEKGGKECSKTTLGTDTDTSQVTDNVKAAESKPEQRQEEEPTDKLPTDGSVPAANHSHPAVLSRPDVSLHQLTAEESTAMVEPAPHHQETSKQSSEMTNLPETSGSFAELPELGVSQGDLLGKRKGDGDDSNNNLLGSKRTREEQLPPTEAAPKDPELEELDFDLEFDVSPEDIMAELRAEAEETFQSKPITIADLRNMVKVGDFVSLQKALKKPWGPTIDLVDGHGMTLAMLAAYHGYDDILELLAHNGANLNAQTKAGMTPLLFAVDQGHLCTVALLVQLGVNLNTQLPNGETALTKAIRRNQKHMVKVLLENGANFALHSQGDITPLKLAKSLNLRDIYQFCNAHISRVTAAFESQVLITLNNTAKILHALFPLQCFSLSEGDRFTVQFKHDLQPTNSGVGMLLFIAHASILHQEVKCRFYGPCAVKAAVLNGIQQPSLTEEANFVLSFSPLQHGRNQLEIYTVKAHTSRAKLLVCAYKAQLTVASE